MAINTISTAILFQQNLDKAAVQQARTGWMETNAGQVKYSGGKEVKIPKLTMDGLGDYDRDNGFNGGSVTFEYQTKEMTHDRGRGFSIDEIDVDETSFIATASTIMGEFQRTKVVPEIDATRIAAISSMAIGVADDKQAEYGYTPAKTTIVDKIKTGIKTIREAGFEGELICYVTYDVAMLVSQFYGERLSAATFAIGGVDTRVPAIDSVPLIEMTSNKMVTKLKFNDGKTLGETKGGFGKDETGLDLNFLLIAKEAPIAVSKTDNMRIFDPNTNQKARAWAMDYRKFHDVWVPDNKLQGLFANIKDAKPL